MFYLFLFFQLLFQAPMHEPGLHLEGVVYDQQTTRPLARVHVYHLRGEEEDFTNATGHFELNVAPDKNARLTAELDGYETASISITQNQSSYQIYLKKKD